MQSPFPGMDSYLEQHWGDVHARLGKDEKNADSELVISDAASPPPG
jgi:hypothetical protein